MEKPKRIRRKIYLIKTGFQLKHTGLILLFMFIVAWITGWTVYYTGWLLMGERLANVCPQGSLAVMMRAINLTLALRLVLLMPLVALLAILLSHRIAGPIYRMEQFLRAVARGDLSMKLRLRKNDELQDLAETINGMIDDLKGRVRKIKVLVNLSKVELERLKKGLGKEVPQLNFVKREVDDLTNTITDLDNHLSEYRLTTVED